MDNETATRLENYFQCFEIGYKACQRGDNFGAALAAFKAKMLVAAIQIDEKISSGESTRKKRAG